MSPAKLKIQSADHLGPQDLKLEGKFFFLCPLDVCHLGHTLPCAVVNALHRPQIQIPSVAVTLGKLGGGGSEG